MPLAIKKTATEPALLARQLPFIRFERPAISILFFGDSRRVSSLDLNSNLGTDASNGFSLSAGNSILCS